MRVAILSDIHGNLAALGAVIADLQRSGGIDQTWVLGDLCAFGPRPAECLQLVRQLPGVTTIRGNTDRYVITGQRPGFAALPRGRVTRPADEEEWTRMRDQFQQRDANFNWTASLLTWADCDYLAGLPSEIELEISGWGRVIGYHGIPGNDEGELSPDTPDHAVPALMSGRCGRLGIGGHTHRVMDRTVSNWRLLNAGSVGMPKDGRSASYLRVTLAHGTASVEFRRVEFDGEATIADLKERGNPGWQWFAGHLRSAVGMQESASHETKLKKLRK